MKVIQINNVYGVGSTGKITRCIHHGLLEWGYDSLVLYGRGEKSSDAKVLKICGEMAAHINHFFSRITGIMYGGSFFSTRRIISYIRKEKPNVVHLQCLNGYFVNIYKLLTWLKKTNTSTVLTLHAEFMYTANCGHALECNRWLEGCGHCPRLWKATESYFRDGTAISWKRMKKAFQGFDSLKVVSVSPWLMERAKQSPILKDKRHSVIYNGLDTTVFKYRESDLRARLGLMDKKIIFHATPMFSASKEHIKGGYYVMELAKCMKDAVFIVAGDYECDLERIDNLMLLGRVNDQNMLAQYYAMADVTVLTSSKETFSMVCAESLCCGTPVVGFEAGGPELIAIKEYSSFVAHGDLVGMEAEIRQTLRRRFDSQLVSRTAQAKYASEKMIADYMRLYEKHCSV